MRAMLDRSYRALTVGTDVSLLVLAASAVGLAAVDLATGGFVRAAVDAVGLAPLDVVEATVDEPDERDLCQPEAVAIGDRARVVEHYHPRQAERWLRPLLHPEGTQLLGFAGPALRFWELDGARPSVALVAAPAEVAVGDDGRARCRFSWLGLPHDLPMATAPGPRLPRRGSKVVVALTPPIGGLCYKVVAGLL